MRPIYVGLLVILALHASWLRAESLAPRPNIVFIIADDLGYADCGYAGGTEIATPHLDRLASAGAVLEAFYVQPVCTPTRAALMTGRYPMRLGLQVGVIRPGAKYGLDLEERTLAQALQSAGYRTAITGKWHLGSFDPAYWPNARGFDHAYGQLFGAIDYFTHVRDGQVDWRRNGEPLDEAGYTTHLLAKEAVGYIGRQSSEQPFFLYVPFNAVHTPLQVPEEYMQPYGHLPRNRRKLAGMLTALDEAVGQIVDAVEKQGLRGNTLFVFSSDNGGYRPGEVTNNGILRNGKGSVYEGGVRSSAFAVWDGHIPAGQRIAEPLHMVDWYPTLINLAGASLEQPRPIDGLDLWPVLTAGGKSPHAEILCNASPTGGAIRMGDWKLHVRGPLPSSGPRDDATPPARRRATQTAGDDIEVHQVELYHLGDDPGERQNLAHSHPRDADRLRARYRELAAEAVPPRNGDGAQE